MKKKLILSKFRSEEEERKFWAEIDLSEYLEADDFVKASFPNLKPSTRPISIRLPEHMIERLKERANEIDVPYQSLIKSFIHKGLQNPG